MSSPIVSVILVTWNSAAHLPRCLDGLEAQTFRDFEVILVDNNSSDGALDAVERRTPAFDLNIIRLDSNRGFAAANNLAAGQARAQWLALLNPDAFPAPDWLEQWMNTARTTPRAFFACRQLRAEQPALLDGEGDVYHASGLAWRRNQGLSAQPAGEPLEVFSACAAAALYPRQAFVECGGFDEDFFAYHEDVDLGFRLRLRGLRCFLVPRSVVAHVGSASHGRHSRFAIYHGHRNLVWTFVKNMPGPLLWLYLPVHLLANLLFLALFSLEGNAAVIWRAKIDALQGLGSALHKRLRVQPTRKVSVSEIYRQLDRSWLAPLQVWLRVGSLDR
jgi:GT2 family glycosyltransferase